MANTRDSRFTRPFAGGSRGGTSMRNVKRHGSFLSGMREVTWFAKMTPHLTYMAETIDLTSPAKDAGDIVLDDGTNGTAWTTAYPGGFAVTLDKNSTAANTEATFLLRGYDHMDRYVEEEIALVAAQDANISAHAYSEVIELELVSEGSTAITDLDVALAGSSDNDITSIDWSGTGVNISSRIGLPFIPTNPRAVRACHYAQTGIDGWIRHVSDGVWEFDSQSASVGQSAVLTDADVYGGDIGNACFLVPAATVIGDGAVITFIFDRDFIRNFN